MITRIPSFIGALVVLTLAARHAAPHATPNATPHAPPDARTLLTAASTAMQGAGSLADVRAIRTSGIQHEFLLGNAERAEGPWRILYTTFSELRDARDARMRKTERGITTSFGPERVTLFTDSVIATRVGPREIGGSPASYATMLDRIDASPDRALMLALAAPTASLRIETPVKHFGLTFDVVSFPYRNGSMRIELSRATHFPVAVETIRAYPHDFRWAPFGDVHVRTEYMDWQISPTGVWWPMQAAVSFNGQPLRDFTVTSVALETAPAAPDSFAVGDSARLQFSAASKLSFANFRLGARGNPVELFPGIIRVPDQWTETMVKQDDGIVLFESHVSGQYLDDVIAEANRRYPGSPIKALVMTSDPWAHLGGFREAVARGIPIYVKDASIPFLNALVHAPHTLLPDALARTPRAPKFMAVSSKTVIGTGTNRIELYPVGGEYGERMLMAYFPGQKVLYGADLIFPNRGPDGKIGAGFSRTPAADLRAAIAREKLDVAAIFCVQAYPPFDGPAFLRDESKPFAK